MASGRAWRGNADLIVDRDRLQFILHGPLSRWGKTSVLRDDLAYVYPVKARRLSLSGLAALVVPMLTDTGIRFVSKPVGKFAERDIVLFHSFRHEEWKIIDHLDGLGYPVNRRVRRLRLYWADETAVPASAPS